MQYNTEAVVIRAIAYGESDSILTLLTPTGTVAAMARGAKKPQSRLAAGAQLCAQGMYAIYQRSGMGNVKQVDLWQTRRGIHEQLELAVHAAYFCELAGISADDRPNGHPAIYRQFVQALDRLMAYPDESAVTARVWETKVLHWLGAAPDWRVCVRCAQPLSSDVLYSATDGGFVCGDCSAPAMAGGQRHPFLRVAPVMAQILERFEKIPFDRLGTIRIGESTRDALATILRIQLTSFAGLSPKSRTVLDSLNI